MRPGAFWERTCAARPIVHAITNVVTVNDCANIIHAAGGAPTMAQDLREMEEITALSDALVLNLGALAAQESMLCAGKCAATLGHPVVFDPVAAGASALRGDISRLLLREIPITVVRGNASEVRALALGSETTRGVEANEIDRVTEDTLEAALDMVRTFARTSGAVIALTGEIDLVSDGTRAAVVRGGSAMMGRITGAGCMLTALIATVCGASKDDPFGATVAAAAAMNTAAQLAFEKVCEMQEGTATFRNRLIDEVSRLTEAQLDAHARIELR